MAGDNLRMGFRYEYIREMCQKIHQRFHHIYHIQNCHSSQRDIISYHITSSEVEESCQCFHCTNGFMNKVECISVSPTRPLDKKTFSLTLTVQ